MTTTQAPVSPSTEALSVSNADETKRMEAMIVALQQQMIELVKDKQAQDSKTALLEQRVTELEKQAHKCDCDQRLASMADNVTQTVSCIEHKLLGLEQDISDKTLDLNKLKTQVDTLEAKARGTSHSLATMMVEVTVMDAKLNRMSGRAPLASPPRMKIDPVKHEERVRSIVAAARHQAKNALNRTTSFESHALPVVGLKASDVSQHSTASVSDRSVHEASDVSQHSFVSTTDSPRSSEEAANAPMVNPMISMDDLQASSCARSIANVDASVDDRFDRLEAMFRVY